MTGHPFRFGVVAAQAQGGTEWGDKARRIESMGYAVLGMPDTVQYSLAPFPALTAAAMATRALRVMTYVVANEYRNPVLLAKEAATVDLLSGGRFELGLGAGRPNAEEDHRMMGIPWDDGAARVARLREALPIVRSLLSGEAATAPGPGYSVRKAQISPQAMQKPHPPILVAAARRRLCEFAALEADGIALGMAPTANEATAAEMVSWIREAAGTRFDHLELNLNVMAVGDQVPRWIAGQMRLSAADLERAGALPALTGSVDQMCETLQRRRERLGISFIMVGDELMEGLAPVVERLAGR